MSLESIEALWEYKDKIYTKERNRAKEALIHTKIAQKAFDLHKKEPKKCYLVVLEEALNKAELILTTPLKVNKRLEHEMLVEGKGTYYGCIVSDSVDRLYVYRTAEGNYVLYNSKDAKIDEFSNETELSKYIKSCNDKLISV